MEEDAPLGGPSEEDGPLGGPLEEDAPLGGPSEEDAPLGGPSEEDEPLGGPDDAGQQSDGQTQSPVNPTGRAQSNPTKGTSRTKQDKPMAPSSKQTSQGRDVLTLDVVTITGDAEDISRVTGSAHRVGKDELERQQYDDVHRVLKQVPGVYVRDEDGFGLRPNIGCRGQL